MADEITIQAALNLQRASGVCIQASASALVTQTGSKGVTNYHTLTTTAINITPTGLASLGFLYVQNLDATNNVILSIGASTPPDFATLGPKQFCLIPINQGTPPQINARANTGTTTQILVAAIEK